MINIFMNIIDYMLTHERRVFASQKRVSLMMNHVFARRVEVARFWRVVGSTGQQCHSYKEYTYVRVFQMSYTY